jgi:hypothetical protein
MPQQLSSQDVLRELRRIRYSSRKGRRLDLSWIARQAGYRRESLYRAMNRGWIGTLMAARVGQVLQNVTDDRSQVTHSSLGEYGGGPDPRGGARFARRARRSAPAGNTISVGAGARRHVGAICISGLARRGTEKMTMAIECAVQPRIGVLSLTDLWTA